MFIACLFSYSEAGRPILSESSTSLVVQVCSNTTDPKYCKHALFSDPRASSADSVVLAYIANGLAYAKAQNISDLIQTRLNSGGNEKPYILAGFKACQESYTKAGRAMMEVLGNLDSETYCGFDTLAATAENEINACENGFGQSPSPMAKENRDMLKLVNKWRQPVLWVRRQMLGLGFLAARRWWASDEVER
ncbi:plant invertase/pectin methylesterase inhibitor, partial [Striga asiatica]